MFLLFSHLISGQKVCMPIKNRKKICSIVFDNQEFWQNMELYLKIASFHIKVLRMVDSDDKPTTVFSTRQFTALKKIQAKSKQQSKEVVFLLYFNTS